jgi:DNA-binding LacI/PurR family transcriptional regulator
MSKKNIRTRPPVVQDCIIKKFKDLIISGDLKPGEQFPSRMEIMKQFQTTGVTVQRAFNRLIKDGYASSVRRKGTFVSKYPPFRHRYALVFPLFISTNNFWMTMREVVKNHRNDLIKNIVIFENLRAYPQNEVYLQLMDDIEARRLAGIVFVTNPENYVDDALLETDIPKVALNSYVLRHKEIPLVNFNNHLFFDKAIERLHSLNRKRLAFITSAKLGNELLEHLKKVMKDYKLPIADWQIQSVELAPETNKWAKNVALLFEQLPDGKRPDGLIVTDDNLLPPVCEALRESNSKAGVDLDVIAHCNYPVLKSDTVKMPIINLGYDIENLVRILFDLSTRTNTEAGKMTQLQPSFEEEI